MTACVRNIASWRRQAARLVSPTSGIGRRSENQFVVKPAETYLVINVYAQRMKRVRRVSMKRRNAAGNEIP